MTVQGVLAARIDQLRAHDKELLPALAVIGNEIPLALAKLVRDERVEKLALRLKPSPQRVH